MIFSADALVNPITTIVSTTTGSPPLPIRYVNMTDKLALYWRQNAQTKMGQGVAQDWSFRNFLKLHNTLAIIPGAALNSFLFSIVLNVRGMPMFPLGMAWCYGPFKSTAFFDRYIEVNTTYLAYLSAAPAQYLEEKKLPKIRVGKALIDATLQFSVSIGAGGRLLLHAAPEGGEHLMAYYEKSGFEKVSPDRELGDGFSRPFRYRFNDGRYFIADNDNASAMLSKEADRRKVEYPLTQDDWAKHAKLMEKERIDD
jgi:hypothetical protein